MARVRSAASLALGLLGRGELAVTSWKQGIARADGFLIHDGALALALADVPRGAERLCQALTQRRDPYSLGGIAQALGLLKNPDSVALLAALVEDGKQSDAVRSFAIGALGLVLEEDPGAWARRLRSLAPLPVPSPLLRDILAHL